MKKKLKMTSKRQVTFPAEVCEALGLRPGDEIDLVSEACQGDQVWTLRPVKQPDRSWMYALREYAAGREHDLEAIRESIAAGRSAGGRKPKGREE